MAKNNNLIKPGEKPDGPGEYIETGTHGQPLVDPRKATIKKGPMPPTQRPGRKWRKDK